MLPNKAGRVGVRTLPPTLAVAPVNAARHKAPANAVGTFALIKTAGQAGGMAQNMSPHGSRANPKNQPFTPPAVNPETIHRCAARNTKVIGSPDSTAAAAKSPHKNRWSLR